MADNESGKTEPSRLSRPTIRNYLKAILDRSPTATPQQLLQSLVEDLEDDGHAVDAEVRTKLEKIVYEDRRVSRKIGFLDLVPAGLKTKSYWPFLSVILVVLTFVLTVASANLISHTVQGALNHSSPTLSTLTAVFQVPSELPAEQPLHFRLTVGNLADKPVADLIAFVSAGQRVAQLSVPGLASRGQAQVEGDLDLGGLGLDNFDFSGYVVGNGISLKSPPVPVHRGTTVVVTNTTAVSADIQEEIERLKRQPNRLELIKASGVLEDDGASKFLGQPSP